MEVILRQDIKKLGKRGETVKVKAGYARNFLIPKNLVLRVTQANLKAIELEKKQELVEVGRKKKEAQSLADRLTGVSCTIAVEAMEDDKLYGNVSSADIASALEVDGIKIDEGLIYFENPIDKVGIFEVELKLHPEITTKVRVWVTKK